MIQRFPRPINPKIKTQTDDQIAKVGQLNQLIRDINNLNISNTAYTGIPFVGYPPATLVNEGPKFTYTDGVELISYHIKGIYPLFTSDGFSEYLCTLNVKLPHIMAPSLFPGSISGMFSIYDGNDIITTPLASGGVININGTPTPISNLQVFAGYYGNNPQPDDSYNYAIFLNATTPGTGTLEALISYDIEFLFPNYVAAPTIFQD
jgi:hypothetical protein